MHIKAGCRGTSSDICQRFIVIPGWGPSLCHIAASEWRQTLDRGVYGNSSRVSPRAGNAPSDINPSMSKCGLCLEKKTKQNILMLLWAVVWGGCGGRCVARDSSATIFLSLLKAQKTWFRAVILIMIKNNYLM